MIRASYVDWWKLLGLKGRKITAQAVANAEAWVKAPTTLKP